MDGENWAFFMVLEMHKGTLLVCGLYFSPYNVFTMD